MAGRQAAVLKHHPAAQQGGQAAKQTRHTLDGWVKQEAGRQRSSNTAQMQGKMGSRQAAGRCRSSLVKQLRASRSKTNQLHTARWQAGGPQAGTQLLVGDITPAVATDAHSQCQIRFCEAYWCRQRPSNTAQLHCKQMGSRQAHNYSFQIQRTAGYGWAAALKHHLAAGKGRQAGRQAGRHTTTGLIKQTHGQRKPKPSSCRAKCQAGGQQAAHNCRSRTDGQRFSNTTQLHSRSWR
jgi:hypothetical protein